jgi:imidazolonepropionase-like amidohydrolase
MSMIIAGATIIDAVSDTPIEGRSIVIENGRISRIVPDQEVIALPADECVDGRGKFAIPGLMDANVHLMGDMRPENLLRHDGKYEDLIVEAAQVALKGGLTTVFDTWGPRRSLMAVRDRIEAGDLIGSRIFCAGNIVGLDGPFSADFYASANVVSGAMGERINAAFVENVGPLLSWMSPDEVALEVKRYIAKGVDFIKYASSEHRWGDPTSFLVFSPDAQAAIVSQAHETGLTAQAHTTSVESLRAAVQAGCDLIQHCNITGPFPIPPRTLELMAEKRTGAVVFPFTERRFAWVMENCKTDSRYFRASDDNVRNLLAAGANLLLATDAILYAPEVTTDPTFNNFWIAPGEDNLNEFGSGHFVWMKAMEEKGLPGIEILRCATINIAKAYGKNLELGTLEEGKAADLLLLDANPLESTENYRRIHMIVKGGRAVDRESLPHNPIQTLPIPEPSDELLEYRAHRHIGRSGLPGCC